MTPVASGKSGRRSGFTLIETLIVVVMMGIVTAMALPSIGRTVSNERTRRGALEVSTFLEYAFAVAGRTGKPVTISYSSSSGVLTLQDRATSSTLRQVALKNGSSWQFQSVTFSPNSAVTVFPNGMSSAAITITVTGMTNALTKTLTASQVGQIRVL